MSVNWTNILLSKAIKFYCNYATGQRCESSSETSPALADVGAGNGTRCVKVPQTINFNYLDAASVVVERFCSLWREEKNKPKKRLLIVGLIGFPQS